MERNDLITKQCRVCGKTFETLHPSRWAFKKGANGNYKWYCSWGCMRKEEKEEEKVKEGMTAGELHKKAMEICIEGGDVLAFLKDNGSEDPSKLWWWIRNKYKKTQHELYDQLPEDQKIGSGKKGGRPKKKPEEPKPHIKEWDDKKTGGVNYEDLIIKAEEDQKKPGLKIRSLDSEILEDGVYTRGENMIMLEIKNPILGQFKLRLTPAEWMNLCDEIHTMVHQFDMKGA